MASYIGRRKFLATLGCAAAGWPLAAHAQRPSIPVIGFLDATTAADTAYRVSAFRDGLKEAGFIDGQTSQSNSAGRRTRSIGCRHSRRIWRSGRWP
jgi:hypothetical protein